MDIKEVKEQVQFMGEDWFIYDTAMQLIQKSEQQQQEIERLNEERNAQLETVN